MEEVVHLAWGMDSDSSGTGSLSSSFHTACGVLVTEEDTTDFAEEVTCESCRLIADLASED